MKKVKKLKNFKKITKVEPKASELRLDFGCGPNPREGFIGVDRIKFPKVDIVMNIGEDKWPWKNDSVDEAHASHFIEHLDAQERIHFVNELFRVLKPGGKFTMITPHWCSNRAYGDLTHKWPPVSEMWSFYLSEEWRLANAPHTDIQFNPNGYDCNFDAVGGYSMRQDLLTMNDDRRNFSLQNYKEVCLDTITYLTKRNIKIDSTIN
jgi:SAM-dependent methyltransferase